MAINNNNTIFILNPVSNKIEYIQNNSVITLKEYSSIEIQDNDEIEYLKSLDCFVVLSNNKVYLISSTGEILDSLLIENSSNITTDLSCIYVKANNNITLLKVVDNKLVTTEQSVIDNCLTNTSVMSYDINNEKLYTFDNKTQKIIYLNNNLNSNQLQFENFNTSNPLNSTSTLLPIKLKNTLIYENPYYTGKVYNESHTIDKCLGIEKHGEFYRVLFNYNDTLNCGFIHQNDILQISQLPNKSNIKVLTTNDIVPVYKYPTILKYDNKTIITGTLPINTKITLDYAYPISIDNKTMYFYNDGTNIGFIYNADVVLDESKNIENLHSDNASIKLIGKDETYIYAEDKTTILYTLKNDDRIHVTNYDKNSDYTLVYYTTSSLETIEGYVPTKDINVDNLDITKIILICLICVSIVILIIIAISYINIKRNQKFNKKEEI